MVLIPVLRTLSAAALAWALLLAPPARAEQPYAHTCDGSVLFECMALAVKYTQAPQFAWDFPTDPARADALLRIAIDGAIEGCEGGVFALCYSLGEMDPPFATPPTEPRYTPRGRMQTYVAATEAACAAGQAEACYWRSTAFPKYKPQSFELGLQMMQAKGLTREEAVDRLLQDKTLFQERARTAAQTQASTLRDSCTVGEVDACAQLGTLLKDYDNLRATPFEHIPLLLDACTIARPAACLGLNNAVGGLATTQPARATEGPVQQAAIAQMQTRCTDGNVAHCAALAQLAHIDKTLDRKALNARACDGGMGGRCLQMASAHLWDYDASKAPADLAAATDLLTRACDLQSHTACHILEHLSNG